MCRKEGEREREREREREKERDAARHYLLCWVRLVAVVGAAAGGAVYATVFVK